ncbi:MAG: PaaX family transcriptional regulator C-terminal domain-containing protein [Microthrixaceae bacterium]
MPDTPVPNATTTGADDGSPLLDPAVPTRLLVLGLAHRNGDIVTSELWPVTDACGLSNDQVRSCLRRLVAEGLFSRDGNGRDATLHATAAGRSLLGANTARHVLAYAQDAAGRGWHRRWNLVTFAIPESRRAARDHLRDRLLALGAAAVQNGVYVSPHPWHDEVAEAIDQLELATYVTMATTDDLSVGGERDPRRIAAALWPLEDIAAGYRSFIEVYRDVPDQLDAMRRRGERLSEADYLPGALHVAIRFNRCFERDPLLPPELLPRPWPGREARDILARCRRIGVLARQDQKGPALFRVFDDAIADLP